MDVPLTPHDIPRLVRRVSNRQDVSVRLTPMAFPPAHGLYDPAYEHDACGLGFVAELKRRPSNDIVQKALEVLKRLAHRGAAGCDPCTGDGCGILLQLPHSFYERVLARHEKDLPLPGDYGVAMGFFSRDPARCAAQMGVLEEAVRHFGQKLIAWRDVAINPKVLGPVARQSMPIIRQPFIGRMVPAKDFERTLFMIRSRA